MLLSVPDPPNPQTDSTYPRGVTTLFQTGGSSESIQLALVEYKLHHKATYWRCMITGDLRFSTINLWQKQFQADTPCWGLANVQHDAYGASCLSQSTKASRVSLLVPSTQMRLRLLWCAFSLGVMLVEFSGVGQEQKWGNWVSYLALLSSRSMTLDSNFIVFFTDHQSFLIFLRFLSWFHILNLITTHNHVALR